MTDDKRPPTTTVVDESVAICIIEQRTLPCRSYKRWKAHPTKCAGGRADAARNLLAGALVDLLGKGSYLLHTRVMIAILFFL